jgi:hypothetical protein
MLVKITTNEGFSGLEEPFIPEEPNQESSSTRKKGLSI